RHTDHRRWGGDTIGASQLVAPRSPASNLALNSPRGTMSIRRTLVASVAVCVVSLNLAGTLHAQSLGELAGAEKERRAAVAENRAKLAAAEAKRQAELLAAEVKRQAAFAATPEG